jgi:integrase
LKRITNPKRVFKDHYTSTTYADVIKKAIKKANRSLPKDQQIPHWTPYQLRHAGVTKLVFENNGGCNIARAVAGQKSIDITQGYNHADLEIAIEQAKKRGK